MHHASAVIVLFSCVAVPACAQDLAGDKPIVIGHRGASGYRPEYTLAAYELAVEQGADVIEPDLVATKDGRLICLHDLLLDDTTNVAELPAFADRKSTKQVSGRAVTGWFACDFTLAEIKLLRTRGRRVRTAAGYEADRPQVAEFDGRFEVATFGEALELAKRHDVGIYPELKQPAFHTQVVGIDLAKLVVTELRDQGMLADPPIRVLIQCFDAQPLRALREQLGDESAVELVQTMSNNQMLSDDGLANIAAYADGIGPSKQLTYQIENIPDDRFKGGRDRFVPTDLVERAHRHGLFVHTWTFRADKPAKFASVQSRGTTTASMAIEIRRQLEIGVDGVFTDHPDVARQTIDEWWVEEQRGEPKSQGVAD